jgi:hypothetical protein
MSLVKQPHMGQPNLYCLFPGIQASDFLYFSSARRHPATSEALFPGHERPGAVGQH